MSKVFIFLNKKTVKYSLLVLESTAAVGIIAFYFFQKYEGENPDVNTMIMLLLFASTLISVTAFPCLRLRTPAECEPLVLEDSEKALIKKYRKTNRQSQSQLKSAEKLFANLSSTKGNKLGGGGHVNVFERWLETPDGSGSIIGAEASVIVNGDYVGKVLLKAPIINTFNNATVVNAGSQPQQVAKLINDAARKVQRLDLERKKHLRYLPGQIKILSDDPRVKTAKFEFDSIAIRLPDHLSKSMQETRKRVRVFVSFASLIPLLSVMGCGVNLNKELNQPPADMNADNRQTTVASVPAGQDNPQPFGGPPDVALREANLQCGTELVKVIEAYGIKDLAPENIARVWFDNSDYKFRISETPLEISAPIIETCATAAENKLNVIVGSVRASCSFPAGEIADAYGLPRKSSKRKIAEVVADDFIQAYRSLVVSKCAGFIK